jgi:hypothetical protein
MGDPKNAEKSCSSGPQQVTRLPSIQVFSYSRFIPRPPAARRLARFQMPARNTNMVITSGIIIKFQEHSPTAPNTGLTIFHIVTSPSTNGCIARSASRLIRCLYAKELKLQDGYETSLKHYNNVTDRKGKMLHLESESGHLATLPGPAIPKKENFLTLLPINHYEVVIDR